MTQTLQELRPRTKKRESAPAIGIDEGKREIAERFARMCRRMADFTLVNEDATLLVWEAADVWNIAIVNYPTTRCSSGHRGPSRAAAKLAVVTGSSGSTTGADATQLSV
jgi:hypothetical protein